jgi:glutathione S-transferase
MQYLASKRPASGVWPDDPRARLDVARWQFWDLAHWDPACAVLVFEHVAKRLVRGDSEPDMAAIAKGTETFHRVAKVLDGQLQKRTFVTGDTLTLADFSLGSALNLAEVARYPLQPYGAIKRWHGELMALPAWRQTLAACALPAAG